MAGRAEEQMGHGRDVMSQHLFHEATDRHRITGAFGMEYRTRCEHFTSDHRITQGTGIHG